jgi:hypothetical protein
MIIIIPSHIKGFYSYCLSPVINTLDIHIYIERLFSNNVLSVDFNLTAEEIGQILGGN